MANELEQNITFQLEMYVGKNLVLRQDLFGALNFKTKCKKGKPDDVDIFKKS